MSQCVKVDTLGRLCNDDLERLYNHFITTNIYLIRAAYNSYFLIIYKASSLIISPWTFSTQLGAGTAWFCLSQCAILFCTLSLDAMEIDEIHKKEGKNLRYCQICAGKGFKNKAKTHNTIDCYDKPGNEDKCPHKTSSQKPSPPVLHCTKV